MSCLQCLCLFIRALFVMSCLWCFSLFLPALFVICRVWSVFSLLFRALFDMPRSKCFELIIPCVVCHVVFEVFLAWYSVRCLLRRFTHTRAPAILGGLTTNWNAYKCSLREIPRRDGKIRVCTRSQFFSQDFPTEVIEVNSAVRTPEGGTRLRCGSFAIR